jgi:hypothetical protein
VIDGGGAPSAVSLTDQDHWHISNLRVTNPAASLARRAGLRISATGGEAPRGFDIGHNPVAATTKPHRGAYNGPGL